MIKPDYIDEGYVDIEPVARGLRLKRCGERKYQGDCPVCNYPGAFSLSVAKGGKKLLGYCHANQCEMRSFFRDLYRNNETISSSCLPVPRKRKMLAMRTGLLDDTSDIPQLRSEDFIAEGTVVETYLRNRGINIDIPFSLRWDISRHSETKGELHECMMGVIERIGCSNPVGYHYTFLKPDGSGKADLKAPRKIFGQYSGGAVFLAPADYKMAISEGIETGLSFQQGTGIPTWAALSSGNMSDLILPPKPMASEIVIAADHDQPGLDAAYKAAERWTAEGRHVEISTPSEEGKDFNDLLMDDLKEGELL